MNDKAIFLSFFDLIVISGLLQGLIYALVIAFSGIGTLRKRLLVVLLLTLCLLSFKILIHTIGFWKQPLFRYFPLAIDCLLPPLIYLYVCSLTSRSFRFNYKMGLHFIIPGCFMLHAVVVYIMVLGQHDLMLKDVEAEVLWYNRVKWIEDIAALLLAVIYWGLAFNRIREYRKWLFENQSDTAYPELSWLKKLLISTGVLILVLLISSLPQNILNLKPVSFFYTEVFYLYLAFLTIYLAFKGYWQELNVTLIKKALKIPLPEKEDIKSDEKEIPYLRIHQAILQELEQNKAYLDPELSLKQLAGLVGYPSAQVSATINQNFGQNFRNLINSYRVAAVKNRLANPDYAHLTLMGIALDCGFNSEASFYRIFRQHDGSSPKAYLRSLRV